MTDIYRVCKDDDSLVCKTEYEEVMYKIWELQQFLDWEEWYYLGDKLAYAMRKAREIRNQYDNINDLVQDLKSVYYQIVEKIKEKETEE